MNQSSKTFPKSSTDPLKLTASAVNYLIKILPKGTAYCIGIVLVVMMTGRLVQSKGSLARAVLPLVLHLKWGWHRVERAMERGKVPLDEMFERAFSWCISNLPVEPVTLGEKQREVLAIDSSTIARYCPLASQGRNGVIGQRISPSRRQSNQSQHHRSSYNCSLHFWGTSRVGASREIWRQLCSELLSSRIYPNLRTIGCW